MEIKQSLSFTAERRRNCDLQKQKTYSGPLMTPVDADTSEAEKLDKRHFEVVPFSLGIGRNQTSH